MTRTSTRRRCTAAAAALALVTVGGLLTGCKAGDAQSAPLVHISPLPEEPAAVNGAHTPAPPSPPAQPAPARTPSRPAEPPKPVKPADPVVLEPGSEGNQVRELQARLQQLGLFEQNPTGYYGSVTTASVKGFQKQRGRSTTGVVTGTLQSALRTRTHTPTRTELHPPTTRPLGVADKRCRTGRVLCIDKSGRTLAWMIDGKVQEAMDVRFGASATPTREGGFDVDFKSRHHHSTLYDSPMPYAMFFSGGQAVHYSSDFAARGYRGASHGCVNVRDKKKIASVFAQVRKGDKVVVTR